MIYVASPYSSPLPELQVQRFEQTRTFVEKMIVQGFVAFSPIVYCHPLATSAKMATDAATWHNFNMNILRRAESLWLLMLPGWDQSKGVQMELRVCKILDIPIIRYDAAYDLADDIWVGHVPVSFA